MAERAAKFIDWYWVISDIKSTWEIGKIVNGWAHRHVIQSVVSIFKEFLVRGVYFKESVIILGNN